MTDDAFACAEIACKHLDADTLENCIKRACPFTHQRRREEDAARWEAKDAGLKAAVQEARVEVAFEHERHEFLRRMEV